MTREEYHKYLASREWAVKREAVRRRAAGMCERCFEREMTQVHHITYIRVGNELLSDLQAICTECHEYESAKREVDPMWHVVDGYRPLIEQCCKCGDAVEDVVGWNSRGKLFCETCALKADRSRKLA